jgi:hypothetical protein
MERSVAVEGTGGRVQSGLEFQQVYGQVYGTTFVRMASRWGGSTAG